jgi:small subunit ribosomal protein S17
MPAPKKKTEKKVVVRSPKPAAPAAQHRTFTGEVVAVNEKKTIRVVVRTVKMNEKYRKQYTTAKKYPVHDEMNKAKVGDIVQFEECRPISKTKRWRLIAIVK